MKDTMKKTLQRILLATTLTIGLFSFTGCDVDDITGFAFTESGGEYIVTDAYDNTLTFDREQAKRIAELGQEDAATFLAARFESKFPESYEAPDASFAITEQATNPVDVQISPGAQVLANTPGAVAPGPGTAVSVGLNALLGLGLLAYRSLKLKQISRKDAALDGAGRLIDGIYNVAEVLPDKTQGKKIVKAVDQGLELVSEVAGAAEELKRAVKRTETPTIDGSVYE